MKESIHIEFAAIEDKQGTQVQYVTTWSLSIVLRLLSAIVEKAMADPNRDFDTRFVDSIAENLSDPDFSLSYSPIVVAINDIIEFFADSEYPTCGRLRLSASVAFEMVDGMHRLAGLVKARLPQSRLIADSVPIVIISNPQKEQMENARRYFQSLHRDYLEERSKRTLASKTMREMAKNLLKHSAFLKRAVDVDSSSLSPRSRKLLTISGLAKGSSPIFKAFRKNDNDDETSLVAGYWDYLSQILRPWRDYRNNRSTASEIRSSTILASATTVSALGRLGAYLLETDPDSWRHRLDNLTMLDWSKTPTSIWEGRALKKGVLIHGKKAELLSCNLMKLICGCALDADEEACEAALKKSGFEGT